MSFVSPMKFFLVIAVLACYISLASASPYTRIDDILSNNNDDNKPNDKNHIAIRKLFDMTTSPVPAAAGEVPRILTPASPPSTTDVQNSIFNWAKSVNTVNAFLNTPTLPTAPLALTWAIDEPLQLKTLSSLPNLSKTGKNAAATLEINFPSIPKNINSTIMGMQSLGVTRTNVNFNRCCTILPAIATLWVESATASNLTPSPAPMQFENACVNINCNAAAS